jgi:hypothetical protein
MDCSETFDPKYVFFTNPEQAVEYFKNNSIPLDSVLCGAVDGGWYERIPAGYHPSTTETYVFAFNVPVKARLLGMLKDLLGEYGIDKIFEVGQDDYLVGHYVKTFNHEHMHELLDKYVGAEHKVFHNPNLEEFYAIDDLVRVLENFDEYEGPFTGPVSADEDI